MENEEKKEVDQTSSPYNKKSIIKYIILVASIMILLIVVIAQIGDLSNICDVLKTVKVEYLLIVLLLALIHKVLWPLSMSVIVKYKYDGISLLDAIIVCSTEFFYNGITPFAAGGQPFQVYAFNAMKVKPSKSTCDIMMNFIIYQVVINGFSIAAMIMFFEEIKNAMNGNSFYWLIILGFSINLLVLILLILVSTTKWFRILVDKLMRLLCKIKFLKKFIEPKIDVFNNYVFEVQQAFRELVKNWPMLLLVIFIKSIALLFFNAIPYFAMKSIGVELTPDEIPLVIGMTIFAQTMVIWVPTPGASGGAEYAFTTLFLALPQIAQYNDPNICISGMLIWRLATYYFEIIYGFIAYLIFERRRKKYENRNI